MSTKQTQKTKRCCSAVLIGMLLAALSVGCSNPAGGNKPSGGDLKPPVEKVTLTITKGAGVQSVAPTSLTVDKGTQWGAVKAKITIKYEPLYGTSI